MLVKAVEYDKDTKTLTIEGRSFTGKFIVDCEACMNELARGSLFFPSHNASPRCESGGRNHCTCDVCF